MADPGNAPDIPAPVEDVLFADQAMLDLYMRRPHQPPAPVLVHWDPQQELPNILLQELPNIHHQELPHIPLQELPHIPLQELPDIPLQELPDIPLQELPNIHQQELQNINQQELQNIHHQELPHIPQLHLPDIPQLHLPDIPQHPDEVPQPIIEPSIGVQQAALGSPPHIYHGQVDMNMELGEEAIVLETAEAPAVVVRVSEHRSDDFSSLMIDATNALGREVLVGDIHESEGATFHTNNILEGPPLCIRIAEPNEMMTNEDQPPERLQREQYEWAPGVEFVWDAAAEIQPIAPQASEDTDAKDPYDKTLEPQAPGAKASDTERETADAPDAET